MSLANFKLQRTAAASRGFLAAARLSCLQRHEREKHACFHNVSTVCCISCTAISTCQNVELPPVLFDYAYQLVVLRLLFITIYQLISFVYQ